MITGRITGPLTNSYSDFPFFRPNDKYVLIPRKSRFLDSWLKNPLYSAWILHGKVDALARCKWCIKDVDVSNMGESALKSHMKGKKHIDHTPSDNCQSLNTHFQKSKKIEEPTTVQVITNSSLVTNENQAAIDNMFTKENATCAGIRWILKTIESKFSLCSCEGTNALFHKMLPDSKIAHSFSLSRTKCNYILNFGLGLFFKIILLIEIKTLLYIQNFREDKWTFLSGFGMKMIKKLISSTSILYFLTGPLQPMSKKPSCQESKNLTKITFYKSPQMNPI